MRTRFIADREIAYDGSQLAPHYIYRNFDLLGDATIAFIGTCEVQLSKMVDLEDVKAEAPIFSPLMLHLLAEFYTGDLHLAVYRQRMLIIIAKELLESLTAKPITRKGDDLYYSRPDGKPGKLSVS